MATFWVDDGATSSWLGPLLVGTQRRSDGRIEVAHIQPELLWEPLNWRLLVAKATDVLLETLGARPGDTVLLCRGSIFNCAAADLAATGFRVERGVIKGSLQKRLALHGRQYLRHLTGCLLYTPTEQIAWVAADPVTRLRYLRPVYHARFLLAYAEAAAASDLSLAFAGSS